MVREEVKHLLTGKAARTHFTEPGGIDKKYLMHHPNDLRTEWQYPSTFVYAYPDPLLEQITGICREFGESEPQADINLEEIRLWLLKANPRIRGKLMETWLKDPGVEWEEIPKR